MVVGAAVAWTVHIRDHKLTNKRIVWSPNTFDNTPNEPDRRETDTSSGLPMLCHYHVGKRGAPPIYFNDRLCEECWGAPCLRLSCLELGTQNRSVEFQSTASHSVGLHGTAPLLCAGGLAKINAFISFPLTAASRRHRKQKSSTKRNRTAGIFVTSRRRKSEHLPLALFNS